VKSGETAVLQRRSLGKGIAHTRSY